MLMRCPQTERYYRALILHPLTKYLFTKYVFGRSNKEKINAVTATQRKVDGKKWQDRKRQTKEKVAFNMAQMSQTGVRNTASLASGSFPYVLIKRAIICLSPSHRKW